MSKRKSKATKPTPPKATKAGAKAKVSVNAKLPASVKPKTSAKPKASVKVKAKSKPRKARGPSQLQRDLAKVARTMSVIRRQQKTLAAIEAPLGKLCDAAKKPEIKDGLAALVGQVKGLRLSRDRAGQED